MQHLHYIRKSTLVGINSRITEAVEHMNDLEGENSRNHCSRKYRKNEKKMKTA